jgi:HPt (histidine-containing phosphotransfer) domain-containing protein
MTERAVLDPAVIATLRNLTPPGEPDVLTEILQMFLQEVPPRIERLRNAWTAGNIEEMRRAAHSLKGSAGNIGAHALHAVCSAIDDQGRSGELADTGVLVAALGVEFGKVATEIHRIIGA